MQPLALSTCWNSYRHQDGYAMLKEIRQLGFPVVRAGPRHPLFPLAGHSQGVGGGPDQDPDAAQFLPGADERLPAQPELLRIFRSASRHARRRDQGERGDHPAGGEVRREGGRFSPRQRRARTASRASWKSIYRQGRFSEPPLHATSRSRRCRSGRRISRRSGRG